MSGGANEALSADARRVLHDACMLRDRLQRLLTALLMTSELAAELLEEAEAAGTPTGLDTARAAREAREHALLYREFATRLSGSRG